jgi:5'-3' exonuclease
MSMGVKKLYKFLSELKLITEYPTLTKYVNTQLKNKNNKLINPNNSIVVAIDFWLYAHKFTYLYGNMFVGFLNQIIKLLSHKIIPLYIYDGKTPIEKSAVIIGRQKKKINMVNKLKDIYEKLTDIEYQNNTQHTEKLEHDKDRLEKSIIYINSVGVENIKKLFDTINIPYLSAKGEADSLCAKLYKDGYITSCLSDDMDILARGCGKTIKFFEGKILEFDLQYILSKLALTYEQFVEMCLLFGCDYVKPHYKLHVNESYNLIKIYGSIPKILSDSNHQHLNYTNEKCKSFILGYNQAKFILMTSSDTETIPINFNPFIESDKEIDSFVILQYLKIHGQLNFVDNNIDEILDRIEYINNLISRKYFCN